MKKTILALALVLSVFTVQAQTNLTEVPNQLPPTPSTFVGSLGSYLTTFNPAFSWVSNRFELSVGADYISGVNWANYIKPQINFGAFDAEANFRNIGIGGQIQSVEAGGGYALVQHFDTKVIGYADGGYDLNRKAGVIEPGVTVKKKGTENTYFEIGLSWPIWFKGPINEYPDIHAGTGFSF